MGVGERGRGGRKRNKVGVEHSERENRDKTVHSAGCTRNPLLNHCTKEKGGGEREGGMHSQSPDQA